MFTILSTCDPPSKFNTSNIVIVVVCAVRASFERNVYVHKMKMKEIALSQKHIFWQIGKRFRLSVSIEYLKKRNVIIIAFVQDS